MQPVTSSDFRNKNQVLSSVKILKNQNFKASFSGGCGGSAVYNANVGDVLDLNHNTKLDFHIENGKAYTLDEPDLQPAYSKLEEFANRYNTEVVTQDDVSSLQIENSSVTYPGKVTKENLRSISTLVKELEPFEKDTKWAIDLSKKDEPEFIIFKPKQ